MTVKTHDILRAAAVLPWTQGEAARDVFGRPCDPLDRQAFFFDVHGAITRAAADKGVPFIKTGIVRDELEAFLGCSIITWADWPHRQQEAVYQALMDCASFCEACEVADQETANAA